LKESLKTKERERKGKEIKETKENEERKGNNN